VWNTGITVAQGEALESLQNRALRIIDDDANYDLILILAKTESLETRCEYLTARFFSREVLDTNSCLLPWKLLIISVLKPYEHINTGTGRFNKSFKSPIVSEFTSNIRHCIRSVFALCFWPLQFVFIVFFCCFEFLSVCYSVNAF